uniref:malate dehydrogenase n=1 Tax=Percolomonas cosmopolitus TaxID=63605 RepID=A0A7S1KTG0_9EUKA|eukprot:CAMPEP_0117444968 /NCGR_PEP_ID=MMETSP0759-20121206/5537_1 /TAXON_ID=63605 /ORGANISM="Percolomonas cosmopolitus, Strain WS" /LENGTH=446 /DNA_ID=CAMNT_0005237097 /DNA_START=10 /DNA_END=1350 /DNA_ORIENTATION=+
MSFTLRKFISRNARSAFTKEVFTSRAYASANQKFSQIAKPLYDYPDDAQQKKDQVVQSLIRTILTSTNHEAGSPAAEKLRFLFATIQNDQDAIYAIQQASRVAGILRFEGHRDVGYNRQKPVVRVAVTGSGGAIGYSLIPRIASGEMLGPDQPVILHLIDLPGDSMKVVKGLSYELEDCAFPLLKGIKVSSDINEGLTDVDYAIFVGSKPRSKGMERADLLKENGKIFVDTGKALAKNAKKNVLSLVVGNPANTNCLVLAANAKGLDPSQFTALTRLDQDRAIAQVANYTGKPISDIKNLNIWGNHSPTMFPDLANATIGGQPALDLIKDAKWIENEFIPRVGKRGAEIIAARGKSSAASAADAAIKHMRDWVLGTGKDAVSMAVHSDGSYGVAKGLYSSFPVVCLGNGKYEIVKNLKVDTAAKKKIQASVDELASEQKQVANLLK